MVEAVGAGVEGVRPGDRVALLWRPRCGRCRYCLAGQPVMCELGRVQAATGGLPDDGTTRLRLDGREVHHLMGVSCFAERVVVSEKSVVPVPDGVPPRIAAITGCAVITGVGAVLNVAGECAGPRAARPRRRRRRAVRGHGRAAGRRRADRRRRRRRRPSSSWRSSWAPRTSIHAGRDDVVEAVLAAVPDGVDWAIEAVGRAETLQQASPACGRAARRSRSASRASARRSRSPSTSSCNARSAWSGACTARRTRSSTCPGCSASTWRAGCRWTRCVGERVPARGRQRGLRGADSRRRGARRPGAGR